MPQPLRPFFSYFGSKWRTVPLYPAPRHATIIESFAGAASYALHHHDRRIILHDTDPIIAGLWAYLIRVKPAEILALPARVDHVDEVRSCQEARWLVGFWLNHGTTHPCKTPSALMKRELRPKSWWGDEIRQRIAAQVESIRHWTIRCLDYRECPAGAATWFIDPPYFASGLNYRHSMNGYGQLGAWCRRRQGQTIVCEQAGAAWLPFRSLASVKAMGGMRRVGRSDEVIWTNDGAVNWAASAPAASPGRSAGTRGP